MGEIDCSGRENINSRAGFTLLETMIALSILAVGLLAMFYMFAASGSGVRQGGSMTDAVFQAQQRVETFRNTPYADIATDLVGVTSGKYTTTWTVSEDAALKLKTITVYTRWGADPTSTRSHEIKLVTMKSAEK